LHGYLPYNYVRIFETIGARGENGISMSIEVKRQRIAVRSTRLETRVTPETKALLQRAASIHGRSLSDFVLACARQEAERTIREHDVIALSVRDSQRFAELVLNPAEPNERLRAAMRLHRSDTASDV